MAVIAVVDDDTSVRESLESLIKSVGVAVMLFASAEDFLDAAGYNHVDCLILDVRLPGMSGIELHRELASRSCKAPVIFITAHGDDDSVRSEVASHWTFGYLTKPFSEEELLNAVDAALKWNVRG